MNKQSLYFPDWEDTTKATAADGRKLLEWFTEASVNMIKGLEDTFHHLPGYGGKV